VNWLSLILAIVAGVILCVGILRMKPVMDYYEKLGRELPDDPNLWTRDEIARVGDFALCVSLFIMLVALAAGL